MSGGTENDPWVIQHSTAGSSGRVHSPIVSLLKTEKPIEYMRIAPSIHHLEDGRRLKWDLRFLGLAEHVSTWSKDPSTKTGAVITRGNRVVSLGYNGFAHGVLDTPELYANREAKYKRVIHCEMNAILFGKDVEGCTLYTWPFLSCSNCAKHVVQAGIRRCVAPPIPDHLKDRWGDEVSLSLEMFRQAGVTVDQIASTP